MKYVLALLALCAVVLARPAAADQPVLQRARVVLVGTPELQHALVVALEPWDVDVAVADDAPPYTEDRAAIIAEARNAAVLVWATGTSLWVYDARPRQMVSRPLEHVPPLDAPAASAAALTIKTMLRSTLVAPAAERLVAGPPPVVAPTAIPPAALPIAKEPPKAAPPIFFIEAGLGAKLIAIDSELRAMLGVSLHPRRLPANLGGAFEADIGSGGGFRDGRWMRGTFALPLRAALVLSGSAIEVGAGPAVSILTLDGSIMGSPVHVVHVDPGLRASVAFELRSASFALALVAAADVQQKVLYKAADATVLEVSPVGVSFVMRLRVGLF